MLIHTSSMDLSNWQTGMVFIIAVIEIHKFKATVRCHKSIGIVNAKILFAVSKIGFLIYC